MDILFLLIAGVTFAAILQQWTKSVTAWKAAAQSLGVEYRKPTFGYPQLRGTVDGFNVEARIRKSGNTMFSRYEASFPPLGFDLHVRRSTGLVRLAEMFGAQDVTLGEPTFDELFQVQSSQPERAAQVLTPPVRNALIAMAKSNPKLTESTITVERRKQDRDPAVITRTVRQVVELAAELSGPHIARESPPSIRQKQPAPEDLPADPWGDSAAAPTPPPTPWTPSQTDDALESEVLTPVFDETAGRRDTGIESGAPDQAASPDEATEPGLSPAQVAEELFGGELLSFEALGVFNDRYAGRHVAWPGTVIDGGLVEVGRLDTKLYGSIPIRVSVSGRHASPGSEVTVDGTLAGMDAFERTLTVSGTLRPR